MTSSSNFPAHREVLLTDARLGTGPSALLQQLYIAPGLAREMGMFSAIIEVDLAHVVMLTEAQILAPANGAALLRELQQLRDGPAAEFSIAPERGSMLLQIEQHMTARLGAEVSGGLVTARSRIDQGATFRRIHERAAVFSLIEAAAGLHEALLALADNHTKSLMPGYTHMQPAQPWVFGHYLLAAANRVHEDIQRLVWVYGLCNCNPLGTVGGSGTSWPIRRERTTELLGFSATIDNARLGRDIRYLADIGAAGAMLMADMNDIATDLQLWSAPEYGFVELDGGHCGTSSIFPQKKNPIALEAIRHAAALALHWHSDVLSISRGGGSGDMAMRTAHFVADAMGKAKGMTDLLAGVISSLTVHVDAMAGHAGRSWLTASHLADLVSSEAGLSYRQAHHMVAVFVKAEIDAGRLPSQSRIADLRKISEAELPNEWDDAWLQRALSPQDFVENATSMGGVAAAEIARLSADGRVNARQNAEWLHSETDRHKAARIALEKAIENILRGEKSD